MGGRFEMAVRMAGVVVRRTIVSVWKKDSDFPLLAKNSFLAPPVFTPELQYSAKT